MRGIIKALVILFSILACVESDSVSVTTTIKSVYLGSYLDGDYPIVTGYDRPRPYLWAQDNSSFQQWTLIYQYDNTFTIESPVTVDNASPLCMTVNTSAPFAFNATFPAPYLATCTGDVPNSGVTQLWNLTRVDTNTYTLGLFLRVLNYVVVLDSNSLGVAFVQPNITYRIPYVYDSDYPNPPTPDHKWVLNPTSGSGSACVPLFTCSGNGECSSTSGSCSCVTNFYGPNCATYCDATTCSGNGQCSSTGACSCNSGWGGPICALACNDQTTCHGNGVCQSTALCRCLTGFDLATNCSTCAKGFANYPQCNAVATSDASVLILQLFHYFIMALLIALMN